MTTDSLKILKLACRAVLILCACEAGALVLSPFLPPLAALAITRSTQIIGLLLLLWRTPGGLAFAGLSQKKGISGLKAGIVWSLGFALAAGITGFLLNLTGINPLSMAHSPVPPDNQWLFFLTGGLISPVAEEIFFRGILYSVLRRLGVAVAVVLSTLVFAFVHGPQGGLPVFQLVGGLVFALSFEVSKSLVTPMVIHVLGNLALFSMALIPSL
ncbi:type II CAAX endopeptidase family protein [Desulfobacula sp.]|uniref:CPBP family intramembrane glutamic endopeptidase n=1 Tax=Desulfobacula sp. TaxID=2593537 RepID=UPI0026185AF1|nr:type II CAAX endopeptidase family protein [Desulfobacula sp.]